MTEEEKHQSDDIGTALRPAGTMLLQRTSLTSNLGISSCWPKVIVISTSLRSSGLVGAVYGVDSFIQATEQFSTVQIANLLDGLCS